MLCRLRLPPFFERSALASRFGPRTIGQQDSSGSDSPKMAQAGGYNNPLKKFKYVELLPADLGNWKLTIR